MKTTKKRLTPETVLIIINEIKASIDDGNFLPKNHRPKTPSIYNVLRVLLDKGVVSKKRGIYLWTGGQPNIYMATEVLKINKIYLKESTEQRFIRQENLQKFLDDLNNQNVMESLDVQEIEYPKEHSIEESIGNEEPIEDKIRNKNKLLREENNKIKDELKKQKDNFSSLLNELVERKDIISSNEKEIKKYQSTISRLEEENQKMFFENLTLTQKVNYINSKTNYSVNESLQQEIEEIKTLPIEIEKPTLKKVKLFGLTILKIE